MRTGRKRIVVGLAAVAVIVVGVAWKWGGWIEFVLGGAMVNVGYRLQDRIGDYDLKHHDVTPEQVWSELVRQNEMSSAVRNLWPRTSRHPVVAMVACMDARLDTNEIAGDTRRYYYIIRLAGSVLSEKEEEMLELAVANGVKVIVYTTHTDCAAEKAARDAVQRVRFPNLARAIDERKARFEEFLGREMIREHIRQGTLLVKWMDLDTATERVLPHREGDGT